MHVSMIVAVARNGVIGHRGKVPWSLRSDMKFFRQTTTNKPVIMGRKTWDSLKAPLVNRDNIVLTRDEGFAAEDAFVVHNRDAALAMALEFAQMRSADEIMIIGGAQVYDLYMDKATRIYLTHVDLEPEGDSFFGPVDREQWQEVSRKDMKAGKKDEADFVFSVYERR